MGQCVQVTGTLHATLGVPGFPLAGPFPNGYSVTAACVSCHAAQAAQVMGSPHWNWAGPAPDLVAPDLVTPVSGTIGKVNLINNFCVGVPSNEKRCDQCHAGYGGDPDAAKPQKSARAYTAAATAPSPSSSGSTAWSATPTSTEYAKATRTSAVPTPPSTWRPPPRGPQALADQLRRLPLLRRRR